MTAVRARERRERRAKGSTNLALISSTSYPAWLATIWASVVFPNPGGPERSRICGTQDFHVSIAWALDALRAQRAAATYLLPRSPQRVWVLKLFLTSRFTPGALLRLWCASLEDALVPLLEPGHRFTVDFLLRVRNRCAKMECRSVLSISGRMKSDSKRWTYLISKQICKLFRSIAVDPHRRLGPFTLALDVRQTGRLSTLRELQPVVKRRQASSAMLA